MTAGITISSKYVSLFPLVVTQTTSNLVNKMFVRDWFYHLCLTEYNTGVGRSPHQWRCWHGRINVKRNINKVQTLRSPNRHKVAQFHTAKQFFETDIFTYIPMGSRRAKYSDIVAFIVNTSMLFESSGLYIKRITVRSTQICTLNNLITSNKYVLDC